MLAHTRFVLFGRSSWGVIKETGSVVDGVQNMPAVSVEGKGRYRASLIREHRLETNGSCVLRLVRNHQRPTGLGEHRGA